MMESEKPLVGGKRFCSGMSEKCRIGKEDRETFRSELKGNISPGPVYNIEKAYQVYVGRRSPHLTISQKFKYNFMPSQSSTKTPGPGAYDRFSDFARDR